MQQTQTDIYEITFTLERFEDRSAVLRNSESGELRWPIKNLPEQVRIGDSVVVKISTQKTEEDEKYARMRKLLEELIN